MRAPITGNTINTARIDAGFTVPELAQELGVCISTVHQWEARRDEAPQIHQRNWEKLKAAIGDWIPSNGAPTPKAPAIPSPSRVAYQVTITGIMICEHGVDPADGDMDSIYFDETFSITSEVDSVRLVPVPASYHPREVREAREGGEG